MENSRKKNETLVYGVLIFLIIFLPFNRANAQVCTPPPANLVSWWPGDGNFADIQDANDGASAGGVTFTAGKVGQAFSFNGASNSFITLPNNQNFVPTGNTFTIDAWIKPDFSQQNVLDTVFTKRDGCGNFGISYILHVIKFDPAVGGGGGHLGRPIGQLTLAMTDSSGFPNIEADSGTTVVPNDGKFHHVAGTYDALTMKVYLDGEFVGKTARPGPILATTSPEISAKRTRVLVRGHRRFLDGS